MNDFLDNELKGRAKFAALLSKKGITDYHFTEDEFNPVDCYFNYNHLCNIAEIKVRNRCYPTLFMEKQKLASMINLIKSGEATKGYYVNFMGDKAYIFGLKDIGKYLKDLKAKGKQIFYSRLLPKTTSGNTEKVWKEIIELPLDIALCVTLKTK